MYCSFDSSLLFLPERSKLMCSRDGLTFVEVLNAKAGQLDGAKSLLTWNLSLLSVTRWIKAHAYDMTPCAGDCET
jgi:hypothetical protein